jgi:hypothetical protein
VTTAVEVAGNDAPSPDEGVLEAPAVLRILWADPQHMAEHLAMWSLARFGPRADTVVEKLRRGHPEADREELERLVVERQARVAATEGAFVGGPFIVLIPVAFCAALLAQGQMVFELAAVAGHEPTDRMRAAELLVLLGAYPSTDAAAEALAAIPRTTQESGKKLPAGTRIDMVRRMAYLLQLLGPTDVTRSRLRATLGWIGIGVLVLVGFVLPLVWVPYMAYSMRRSTLRLGARGTRFYAAEEGGGDVGLTVHAGEVIRIGGVAALARTTFLVVTPIVLGLVALLTDFNIAGGSLVTSGIVLIVVSALCTLAWFGYRTWRRQRHAVPA